MVMVGGGATVEQCLRFELGLWASNPFKETNAELLTSNILVMKKFWLQQAEMF